MKNENNDLFIDENYEPPKINLFEEERKRILEDLENRGISTKYEKPNK